MEKDRILIVDDDDINREILADMLERQAITLEAENGSKAISIIDTMKERLGMVLLDLNMPGIDGFAVLNFMKNKGLLDRIPVVVISGETDDSSVRQCFDYGVQDFLPKPYREDEVRSRVSHILELYRPDDTVRDAVLIVDDEHINRDILKDMLEDSYRIFEAANGSEAIRIMGRKEKALAMILLDLHMPGIDGFGVLDDMEKTGLIRDIPVIIISDEKDEKTQAACFELGVSDFISKPYSTDIVRRRVNNCIDLNRYRKSLEKQVEIQMAEIKSQNRALKDMTRRLEKNNAALVNTLGTLAEFRDGGHNDHVLRISEYVGILAGQLAKDFPEYGLDHVLIEDIRAASALHDFGMIAMPESILEKGEDLDEEELELLKTHPARGGKLIMEIDAFRSPDFQQLCRDIARYHHERYDGNGYPDGLVGDQIPVAAQIVGMADAYDEIVSGKNSTGISSPEEAAQLIIDGKCGVFNPRLLHSFKRAKKLLENIEI